MFAADDVHVKQPSEQVKQKLLEGTQKKVAGHFSIQVQSVFQPQRGEGQMLTQLKVVGSQ